MMSLKRGHKGIFTFVSIIAVLFAVVILRFLLPVFIEHIDAICNTVGVSQDTCLAVTLIPLFMVIGLLLAILFASTPAEGG